jgi:hypothetical protein
VLWQQLCVEWGRLLHPTNADIQREMGRDNIKEDAPPGTMSELNFESAVITKDLFLASMTHFINSVKP